MTSAIVLFTRDLRVHDHAALCAAVETASEVVPLFVFDEALRNRHRSAAREAFLLDSLVDLREALCARGGGLVVRRGDPIEETMRVAHATGSSVVFVGADASSYAERRRQRLEQACRSERIELRRENTIAAIAPGELVPAERDHYRVFTPYWRHWRELPLPTPLDAPTRVTVPAAVEFGALPSRATGMRGGEHTGRRRLGTWLRSGLHEYERARNDLDKAGTSRLSPYLHFGCISANEVVVRAREQGAVAEEFVRQLCWRDFYLQLLAANPRSATEDLHQRDRGWIDDDDAFAAWAAGRTGYPIIDAAMRQLRDEGWMHNRARLLVGSFLTKTLGIDWRRGAEVFFELLVDGDIANNVGNWQWVAGTGVDSRPNRVFNPVAQAKRLDPDGAYVRRNVPELAGLTGASVHEPWRAPLAARAPEYPERIVEYLPGAARA
jgi:deoxyribodipyrimidine photo-lyase